MNLIKNDSTNQEIGPSSELTSSALSYLASSTGFSYTELKNYSMVLLAVVIIGFICHTLVLVILIYQQLKSYLIRKSNKANNDRSTMNNKFMKTIQNSNSMDLHSNPLAVHENNTTANNQNHHTIIRLKKFRYKEYNNYVTYAFVFHQTLVDLLRIFYSLFYANRLYFDYKRIYLEETSHEINQNDLIVKINQNDTTYFMNNFYEKYCTQMASFYSVLTMVTIVNILTILISETCRFYDLKLNSSDTSNYCCVLFGIMLIWISSLIIISSLMLVGVADSAAPTWRCDLGESESTTRSLVINIVWFLLIAFVLLIAFSYSFSLYKELTSMEFNEDNSTTAALLNPSLVDFYSELLDRHLKIVKETTKRLFILVLLIVLFCLTFLPNFITTVLKNTINTNLISLNPYNLISSIINLSNSSLNSIVLLFLCVKSNDNYLTQYNLFENDIIINDEQIDRLNNAKHGYRSRFTNLIHRLLFKRDAPIANKSNAKSISDDSNNCVVSCNDECIRLKSLGNSFNNKIKIENAHQATINPTNIKEFYSKVGNRLGNLN